MEYITTNGVKYGLAKEDCDEVKLADIPVGETCKIGEWEFIVCEHTREGTVLLMKDCLYDEKQFGNCNNYNESDVDTLCEEFSDKLAEVIGAENIILHTVDLTADDGLKDYGEIKRRVSLFTANQYRKYCDILDNYRLDKWTWTATAYSTPKHGEFYWVKCVAPRGDIDYFSFNYDFFVRPSCILKSDIFVSK